MGTAGAKVQKPAWVVVFSWVGVRNGRRGLGGKVLESWALINPQEHEADGGGIHADCLLIPHAQDRGCVSVGCKDGW